METGRERSRRATTRVASRPSEESRLRLRTGVARCGSPTPPAHPHPAEHPLRSSTLTLALTTAVSMSGLVAPLGAGAQQTVSPGAFVGTWEGVLDTGGAGLRLVLHLTTADDGGFSGTLDSPDQGATGIPASEVTVSGGELRFAVDRIGMAYTATLSRDGATLNGTFTQGGRASPSCCAGRARIRRRRAPRPTARRTRRRRSPTTRWRSRSGARPA